MPLMLPTLSEQNRRSIIQQIAAPGTDAPSAAPPMSTDGTMPAETPGPWMRYRQQPATQPEAGPWTRFQQKPADDPILLKLREADAARGAPADDPMLQKLRAADAAAGTGTPAQTAAEEPQKRSYWSRLWSPFWPTVEKQLPPGALDAARQESRDQARVILQGASLGTADEIEAGLRTGFGYAGNYGDTVAQIRDSVDRGRDLPGGTALEIAGGLAAPGLGVGKFVAGAPTMLGKVARGGVGGTAVGGVSGFASGESMDERLAKAESGAKLGAAVGAAAPPVVATAGAAARGVRNVSSTVADGLGARFGVRDEEAARRLIADALMRESPDVAPRTLGAQTYARAVDTIGAPAGSAQPLAIVGTEAAQDAARAAAAASPLARRAIGDAVEQAQATAGSRTRALADPTEYTRTAESLAERRANEASAAYERLYRNRAGRAVDMSDVAGDAPAWNAAVARANEWLSNAGHSPIAVTGAMTPRQVDMVTRALDDATDTAFRSGASQNGHAMSQLRDAWTGAAYRRLPRYQSTRETYRQQSNDIRALELGRDLVRREGPDTTVLRAQFDALTPEQQNLARTGSLQALYEGSQNAADVGRWATATSTRGATRDAMSHVFGNAADQAAAALARARASGDRRAIAAALLNMDRATRMQTVPRAVSRDAQIAAGANALEGTLPEATSVAERAAGRFDPIASVWRPGTGMLDATRAGVRLLTDPMNPARAEHMARMLTDRSGDEAMRLARELAARPDAQSIARRRAVVRALQAKAAGSAAQTYERPVE